MASTEEALEALRRFLELTPPNTPVSIAGLAEKIDVRVAGGTPYWTVVKAVPKQVHLYCDHDDGVRRFNSRDRNQGGAGYTFLTYVCRDCGVFTKTFAVVTELRYFKSEGKGEVQGQAQVMKLGEFPPFGAPISKRVRKVLEQEGDLELYRQGMRAEAQGLGLGAASYLRRIVDDNWKRLVQEIREAAAKLGQVDLGTFDAALQETQFSKAVQILKDAIPPKLLILDGQNPLTLLYRPLSVQLHDLSDEQCLRQAADIRLVLTALLENIADVMRDQAELKAAAARLSNH